MAERKASEGIMLLSMYDDEDDEMEAVEEHKEETATTTGPDDAVLTKEDDEVSDGIHGNEHLDGRILLMQKQQIRHSEYDSLQLRRKRLTIVDYGHEEGALSPETEDVETQAAAQVVHGEQPQTIDGESQISPSGTPATTPQLLDQTELLDSDVQMNDLDSAPTEDEAVISEKDKKDADLLERFLGPPTDAKCSQDVQDKIIKFIALKKNTGRNFNSEVRNRKEYRNPDFLLHAVTYQNIDQIGSCFSKDVFDPHGYDKSDFYDELEVDMRREIERKEQERKSSQKIDFSSAGVQSLNVISTAKISLPTPTTNTVVTAPIVPPTNSDITGRDGRQSKKSKWDKVDPDARFSTSTGEKEIISTGIAGGGYAAYAQQRRRDSEERRTTERK